MSLKIEYLKEEIPVYDITVVDNHNFYANNVLVHNCAEITLCTTPITHIDDPQGEIATCILSAINVGLIKEFDDLEELCDLAVRALEEIIDYQKYPVLAAENFTKNRRALGIGYIGLAHFLAKHHVKYSDPQAWKLVHDLSEAFQYYLLKSSNQLAREKGVCAKYDRTKYVDGVLPIDTYKQAVDDVVPNVLNYDWESLREDIKRDGLRHSTLSSEMPSESSSITSNATNGIEPPRGHLSVKKSKKGTLKQIVPQYQSLKNHYTLLWDMESNEGYFNIVAVMQKFYDQSISANWSYNPTHYPNNEIPMSVIMNDLLMAYKLGHKTAYYLNTYDYKTEEVDLDEKPLPPLEGNLDDDLDDPEICESCAI